MPKNKKDLLCISLLGIVCAQPAFSYQNNTSALMSWLKSSFVMTLSGGPGWTSPGETQTLNLAPGVIKTYTANQSTDTIFGGDLFMGVQVPFANQLKGQVGLDIAATSNTNLSGDVWDDGDPEFNNYTYHYKIQHKHVALKGKLLIDRNWPVIPWISAEAGVGYNRASYFSSSPTIYQAVPVPGFASKTISSFTFAVGIGFQHAIQKNWQVGLGYEFSDWGKSQLGSAEGSNTSGLSLSHLYVNSLLFNVTYVA